MNSTSGNASPGIEKGAARTAPAGVACPRCGTESLIELQKADPEANTVFRCRPCGHIFSPRRQAIPVRAEGI